MSDYQPQADDDDLVDAKEASVMIHTPVKTIYSWCDPTRSRDGQRLPFIKMGRRYKFRKGDLRRFVHEHYHPPGNGTAA